jgi:hypothetical protein
MTAAAAVILQSPLLSRHHELLIVFFLVIIDADRCSGHPPTETLNRTNHLAWKAIVLPAFRGARVMGLLDGTDRAPSETMELEDEKGRKVEVENLAYAAWIERDQLVL